MEDTKRINNKTALIGIADLHVNSTVSLCPPVINLDDGGTYRASREQRQLWEWWLDFIDWSKRIAGDARKIGVIVGDLIELDIKRRSVQLITGNRAVALDMLRQTLEPFVDILDGLIVIRGTPAHTGKGSWAEEEYANDCTITIKSKTASHYYFRGSLSGVRFDICHHATMGHLPWTERLAAGKLASTLLYSYLAAGEKTPHVAIRGHNHRWSIDTNQSIHVYYLPCWGFATEYVYTRGIPSIIADIGGGLWMCDNGEYVFHKRDYRVSQKMRHIWREY